MNRLAAALGGAPSLWSARKRSSLSRTRIGTQTSFPRAQITPGQFCQPADRQPDAQSRTQKPDIAGIHEIIGDFLPKLGHVRAEAGRLNQFAVALKVSRRTKKWYE